MPNLAGGNSNNSKPCVNSEQFSSWLRCSFSELREFYPVCANISVKQKSKAELYIDFWNCFCLAASLLEFFPVRCSYFRFPELSSLCQFSKVAVFSLTTFFLFYNSECASEVITWLSLFIFLLLGTTVLNHLFFSVWKIELYFVESSIWFLFSSFFFPHIV